MSDNNEPFLGESEEKQENEDQEVMTVPSTVDEEAVPQPTEEQSESRFVAPASNDLDEIAEIYERYEKIKSDILSPEDRQKIGGNIFIKKSGWRKIANAFNLTVEVVETVRENQDGVVRYTTEARAIAPNGKYTDASGSAASNESNFMDKLEHRSDKEREDDDVFKIDGEWRVLKDPRAVNQHDIRATAETRAKNRAISDLVGGGEVSAEELDKDELISS